MPYTFTTLRHPVEKLLEAEHFVARLIHSNGLEFQFELNAFLSASRSLTFVLQKAMADVSGFASWYEQQQTRMKADAPMCFFLSLRNVSQKQGPISICRGARSGARDRTIRRVKALGRRRWKKASGYHQHARVENAFFRYTSIVGDCLRARSSSGQRREAVLACNVLNRMTELGRPVSYRIGR